jgi:predicted RNase H-like HicB family nuclease
MIEFTAIVEYEDGIYTASVRELKGCRTQAKDREELWTRIKEAIHVFIEDDVHFELTLIYV